MFACIGAVLTARGLGPISLMHGSVSARAEFFQFYIAIAVLTVLPAAAELRRRERLFLRLQESEARYRLLSDKSGDPVIHLSPEGEVRFASPAIMALTGYRPEDVIGRSASDFVMGEDYPKFDEARIQALSDTEATITVEYRANTRDRGFEWRETQMRSYTDERGTAAGIVIVIRDISRRKIAEAELEQAATTDQLTGLPNRRPFFEQLERLAAFAETSRPSSVALFDLDFFKRVNDLHGHSIGDAVLRTIASAAGEAVRGQDLLARIGGEEFGLLLIGADEHQAHATCERVRAAIAACVIETPDGQLIGVTASFGLAPIVGAGASNGIFDAADKALYQAKATGRDRVKIAA